MVSDTRWHSLLLSSASATVLLLLLLEACLTPSVTGQRSLLRLARAAKQRISGDAAATFTLESPVSEEEAVELVLFGRRLPDVSGVDVELRNDDGSQIHRRLHVPGSVDGGGGGGGGFASQLRWSLCGCAGVDTVLVRVLWSPEAEPSGRRLNGRVNTKNVLIEDGGGWSVRSSSVEYRRVPWRPSAGTGAPAVVVLRSPEPTDAIACLKHECVDDGEINSLSPDDLTCQEFTDCATFDIEQGRPSFLYVRPRATHSPQLGKPVTVRFGAGVAPPEWTSPAAAHGQGATECPRRRLGSPEPARQDQEPSGGEGQETTESREGVQEGVEDQEQQQEEEDGEDRMKEHGQQQEGRMKEQGQEEEKDRTEDQERQEGRDGAGGATAARRPVKVLLKTSVTVYRPRQTERTLEETGRRLRQGETRDSQRQQSPAAAAAAEEGEEEGGGPTGASSSGPDRAAGPPLPPLLVAGLSLLLCRL